MSDTKMITQQPVMKTTIPIPENRTTPDKVETSIGTLDFFDGVPVGDTKDTLIDFVQRGRAVEAFINMTPAASMYSLRQGHRDLGLTECNQILIAEQLGDSKPLVLTWNNTSLYTWGFLDLKKDGPTVIDIPPDVLGILDDMYFRYMSDMGAAGPDHGKGGKYLVLPPGYDGDVPDGYYVVQSPDVLRVELHAWLRARQRPGPRQRQEGVGQHQTEPQGVSTVQERTIRRRWSSRTCPVWRGTTRSCPTTSASSTS